jgi:hypothetical protein
VVKMSGCISQGPYSGLVFIVLSSVPHAADILAAGTTQCDTGPHPPRTRSNWPSRWKLSHLLFPALHQALWSP